MEKNIKELSDLELKAYIFDLMELISGAQKDIQMLTVELKSRKPKDPA